MSEPMTAERWAFFRGRRDAIRANLAEGMAHSQAAHEIAEVVDEIERLKALADRREAVADDIERAKVGANLIAHLTAENERLKSERDDWRARVLLGEGDGHHRPTVSMRMQIGFVPRCVICKTEWPCSAINDALRPEGAES